MIKVLVTGANGQLASCIKDLAINNPNTSFVYTDYLELDISNLNKVDAFFIDEGNISYCINCAAYTAVDKAETDIEKAYEINAEGAKNLALVCAKNNTVLIHISTDFVFDGLHSKGYVEKDQASPISVYGASKLKGEQEIVVFIDNYFIIRTSWLYSEYGNNFMKTMLRMAESRNKLNVVGDQIGTPTYAKDLASVILKIINNRDENYGLYHYSNQGAVSWYDFAKAIFEDSKIEIDLHSIKTEEYPTLSKRPIFSVLNKEKIKKTLNIEIPYWRDSLKKALKNYDEQKS